MLFLPMTKTWTSVTMQKWEYLAINVSYREGREHVIDFVSSNYRHVLSTIVIDELHAFLNKLGQEGWKRVTVHFLNEGLNEAYYFRRLITGPTD